MLKVLAAVAVIGLGLVVADASGNAADRHAGYYYPAPTTHETYGARATAMPTESRELRLGFVTGLSRQQLGRPYPPTYAIFAKGSKAEKMIIVALGRHGFQTLFQARGLLAQLTAVARSTKLLQDLSVETTFTFFDVAKLLGFKQITISDGSSFAHQVTLD